MLIELLKIRSMAGLSIKKIFTNILWSSIVCHHAVRLVFFERKCKKFSARNILLQRIIRSKSKNETILH